MSDHRWIVYFIASTSVGVEVTAPSRDAAIEAAWEEFDGGPTPCHQCSSNGIELGDYDVAEGRFGVEDLGEAS